MNPLQLLPVPWCGIESQRGVFPQRGRVGSSTLCRWSMPPTTCGAGQNLSSAAMRDRGPAAPVRRTVRTGRTRSGVLFSSSSYAVGSFIPVLLHQEDCRFGLDATAVPSAAPGGDPLRVLLVAVIHCGDQLVDGVSLARYVLSPSHLSRSSWPVDTGGRRRTRGPIRRAWSAARPKAVR